MEKINKNIIIYLTIAAIILILGIPTIYKVVKNHYELLRTVEQKKIKESALQCKNDNKCIDNTITLQELYDLGYLEEQYDPITKRVYNSNSKIIIQKNKVRLKLN